MATTGAARAKQTEGPELVTVTVQEGKPSQDVIKAVPKQRIAFQNQDDREYRLRLREGKAGRVVGLCVFLPGKGFAEMIVDPAIAKLVGVPVVEIIPAGEIFASGPIKGGGVNPPKTIASGPVKGGGVNPPKRIVIVSRL